MKYPQGILPATATPKSRLAIRKDDTFRSPLLPDNVRYIHTAYVVAGAHVGDNDSITSGWPNSPIGMQVASPVPALRGGQLNGVQPFSPRALFQQTLAVGVTQG